jgi:exopolysaccharide production protein ExoZ
LSWEKARPSAPNLGFLASLGDASYVLYLVHYPLISALCKVSASLLPHTIVGASVAYTVILIACLVAAIAVHLWIERPLLRSFSPHKRRV